MQLTQEGLLFENVLVDKCKQRRPRSVIVVIVVIVVDGHAVRFALQQQENQTKAELVAPLLPHVLDTDGSGLSTTLRSLELPMTDCFREPISQPYVVRVHLQRDPVVLSRCESVDVVVPQLLHHGRQLPVALDHAVFLVPQWMSCGRSALRSCV